MLCYLLKIEKKTYADFTLNMSLEQFSRVNMRALKSLNDEENNSLKIDAIVKQLYEETVRFAENNVDAVFRKELLNNGGNYGYIERHSFIKPFDPRTLRSGISYDDILRNIEEILNRLRNLFPDCDVVYKKTSIGRGMDGKEYDISTLDEKVRPFINPHNVRIVENIVIDWS